LRGAVNMLKPKAGHLLSRAEGWLCGICLSAQVAWVTGCCTFSPVGKPGFAPARHPSRSEDGRVFLSLRVLQQRARENPREGLVRTMGGIGWLEGYVLDRDLKDIVLVGRASDGWPSLRLDDLAVNLRNAVEGGIYPLCSLDPKPENIARLRRLFSISKELRDAESLRRYLRDAERAVGPQLVVVDGVPQNSRHASIMIAADYHMKKLSQGSAQVDGVASCLDLRARQVRRIMNLDRKPPPLENTSSRFWFHVRKGDPSFFEAREGVFIDRCDVVVSARRQEVSLDGKLTDTDSGDPLAEDFANRLSMWFEYAATRVPEYAELENLFRLVALVRAMHFRRAAIEVSLDLDYLLRDYVFQDEQDTPASLPGLANSKQFVVSVSSEQKCAFVYTVCGGVSMDVPIRPQQFRRLETIPGPFQAGAAPPDARHPNSSKQVQATYRAATALRPSAQTLCWRVGE